MSKWYFYEFFTLMYPAPCHLAWDLFSYKYSSRSCNPQSVLSGELSCSAIFISHMYASYHDVITCVIRYQYSFSEYTLAWLPHATSHYLTYMRSILSQINYLYYVLFISYILTGAYECLVRITGLIFNNLNCLNPCEEDLLLLVILIECTYV